MILLMRMSTPHAGDVVQRRSIRLRTTPVTSRWVPSGRGKGCVRQRGIAAHLRCDEGVGRAGPCCNARHLAPRPHAVRISSTPAQVSVLFSVSALSEVLKTALELLLRLLRPRVCPCLPGGP